MPLLTDLCPAMTTDPQGLIRGVSETYTRSRDDAYIS